MKKIAALVLVVSMLLLVSCSSILGGVKISSERAKEIVETIRENAEENDMLFVKESIYIPKVFLENEYDFEQLELNAHDETLKYIAYFEPNDTLGEYNVLSFAAVVLGEEELEEVWEDINEYYIKYKKGGKEFYIGNDDFSSNITFLYFIDRNMIAAVSLEVDSKVFEGFEFGDDYSAKDKPIPKKVAHKIFDDLQMISLAELEKIGKK